jgi:hypothetical protein
MGDWPIAWPCVFTGRHKHGKKRRRACMTQVEFEPATLVFEQSNTIDVLDRAATVKSPFLV